MKILILDDGFPGNTNQSLGIVEALECTFHIFPVEFYGPSYKLPGRKGKIKIIPKIIGLFLYLRLYNIAYIFYKIFSKNPIPKNSYDIVISTGSFLSPINLLISKKINAKSICIMTPEYCPKKKFDILFIPFHDYFRYSEIKKLKNVYLTIGAPNRITPSTLEKAKEKILKEIQIPVNSLKAGILIGGNDQNYLIDITWAKNLLNILNNLATKNFVFLLTVSRRTPEVVSDFFYNKLTDAKFIYREFPGIKPGTHYFGILSISDIIFVTEDSINMISEACSTGKPVIILGVGRRRKMKKIIFDITISKLVKDGYCIYIPLNEFSKIPSFVEKILKKKTFPVLNESKKCAQKIMELMNQKES